MKVRQKVIRYLVRKFIKTNEENVVRGKARLGFEKKIKRENASSG